MAGTVINLDLPLDVRRLGAEEELIQHQAFDRLTKIIEARLEGVSTPVVTKGGPEDEGDILFDRRHATIVVHGSRGSGKTTFIRNAFAWYKANPKYKDSIGANVCFLGVLDPTLIESKENVFVILINKIRAEVERTRPRREWHETQKDGREDYEAWRQKLKALAAGLISLPDVGPDRPLGENWEDAQYVLRRGLDKADAGMRLEERFHDFIRSSLAFLGKKAFLIALDDIDTDFKRGWPVLEVMRRYVTSPHFITVLSGDMDLYSMLVRGVQWTHFPAQQLQYDEKLRPAILEMIDHLQGQYLLKLLAQESRINLRPLADLDDVEIESKDHPRESLGDFMTRLAGEGFGFGGADKRRAADLMRRQPMRTALSVMKAFTGKEFVQELPSIFIDVLTRHNTQLDDLMHAVGRRLPLYISQFLTKNQLWESAHNLLPDHGSDDLNLALLAISTKAGEQFAKSPGIALGYMLRVCFVHELLTARLQRHLHEDPTDFMKSFIDFTELDRDGSMVELARRFVAIIQGDRFIPVALGTAHTYRRAPPTAIEAMYRRTSGSSPAFTFRNVTPLQKSPIYGFFPPIRAVFEKHQMLDYKPTSLLGNFYNTVDSMVDRIRSPGKLPFAALPAARILNATTGRATFVSVHNLIAFVAELLHAGTSGEDAVLALIRTNSVIRSYPVPSWGSPQTPGNVVMEEEAEAEAKAEAQEDEENRIPDDSDKDSGDEFEDDPFVQALVDWAMDRAKKSDIRMFAPGLLARAWSRFYFSLANVDDKIREQRDERFLGALLHRQIVLFLNALLVEEASQGDRKVQTQNPTGSDQIFTNNWDKHRDAVPFTRLIASCPLWCMYVDPGRPVGTLLRDHARIDPNWLTVDYEIIQISNRLALQGQSNPDYTHKPVTVQYHGLCDLYNSIAIPELWGSRAPRRTKSSGRQIILERKSATSTDLDP